MERGKPWKKTRIIGWSRVKFGSLLSPLFRVNLFHSCIYFNPASPAVCRLIVIFLPLKSSLMHYCLTSQRAVYNVNVLHMVVTVNTVHPRCDPVFFVFVNVFLRSCTGVIWFSCDVRTACICPEAGCPPTEKLHGIERCVVSVAGRMLLNKQVDTFGYNWGWRMDLWHYS
jgi:hypothetical protein